MINPVKLLAGLIIEMLMKECLVSDFFLEAGGGSVSYSTND